MSRYTYVVMLLLACWVGSVDAGQLGQSSGGGTSYPSALDTSSAKTDPAGCDTTISTRNCAKMDNDLQAAIIAIQTELGTLPKGAYTSVKTRLDGPTPVANGGTGQTTAQTAINALTAVSGATNEYVLTKDTATGNAIFKVSAGGGGGAVSSVSNSNGTLTISPTTGAVVASLNLGQGNTWTATQTMPNLLIGGQGVGVDAKGMTVNDSFKTAFGWMEPGSLQTDYSTTSYTEATNGLGPMGIHLYLTNKTKIQKEGIFIRTVASGVGLPDSGCALASNNCMHSTGLAIEAYMGKENGGESSGIWIAQRGEGNGIASYQQCDDTLYASYYSAYGVTAPRCNKGAASEFQADGTQLAIVSTARNQPTFLGRLDYGSRAQAYGSSTQNGLMGVRIQPLNAAPPATYRAWSVSQSPVLGNGEDLYGMNDGSVPTVSSPETSYITMGGEAYFAGGLRAKTSGVSNQTDILIRVNGGTEKRVYIGAPDTGGAGFRLLAILN